MNQPADNNDTLQPTVTLDEAIAQAVFKHQQETAEADTAAAIAQRQAEQDAIARFRLPFDQATLDALPTLKFRFEGETNELKTIGWFTYQDLTIEINAKRTTSTHCQTWEAAATRNGTFVKSYQTHVYPNQHWAAYSSPEEEGRDFLVFLHNAAHTPTPAPKPPERTITDTWSLAKRRERFVRAAMQGTLMGLTTSGVEAGTCLQTALFAIETAEQVLALMDATPLQRQVLSVLTLEQFTDWLRKRPCAEVVGNLLYNSNHPVCNYIQQTCGISLYFSNLALHDQSGFCVLGNDGTAPVPHELPLDFVGEWLPALLNWKEIDPDNQQDCPTFTALEVLSFLEPFQA